MSTPPSDSDAAPPSGAALTQALRAQLSYLSHEARTPLNALMGLNRLLADSGVNAEQRHWLDLMQASADALLQILQQSVQAMRQAIEQHDVGGAGPLVGPAASLPAAAVPAAQALRPLHEYLELSPEEMAGMAEGLVDDLTRRLTALRLARAHRDSVQIGRELHLTMGSLQFVRAERALGIARSLDMARQAGEWGVFDHAFVLLDQEIEASLEALKTYLG